jgi:phospholipid-binding lipoprotein MlaA
MNTGKKLGMSALLVAVASVALLAGDVHAAPKSKKAKAQAQTQATTDATVVGEDYSGEGLASANTEVYDPIEPVNRAIQGFNDVVDTVLLRPIAIGYQAVIPQPARESVTNALRNLNEPVNAVNALLQGDPNHMFTSIWRFVLNSTLGIGGLFDFAGSNAGLQYRKEDFGQTFGHYGAGPGPYLVLPLLGPSNVRDTFGLALDIVSNPFTWVIDWEANLVRAGLTVIDTRERNLDFTDDVAKTSIDPYATYRSAYTQYRVKQINTHTIGMKGVTPRCH